MLRRLDAPTRAACVPVAEAKFPAPFVSGLEYGAPARGVWNIVHTGMLIPEAHEIFVCASNCLRGVVLTAAEMGESHRFSTVTICEQNVLDGDMEELIVEGVSDILRRLPQLPPAVLVYTSCVHHFMGTDLNLCYDTLRSRFPGVAFTDCYMNPIMRKSGLTPDQLMRRQLYSLLEPKPLDDGLVNLIGNNLPTDESSELVQLVRQSGRRLLDITACRTYRDYQTMAASARNLATNPAALPAARALQERLGQPFWYLPVCYGAAEIHANLQKLADALGTSYDGAAAEARARCALQDARQEIGDTPIAIDYTATARPLGLARLLLEAGFRVERIYADSFSGEEKEDFLWLQQHAPDLSVYATVQVQMRVVPRTTDGRTLAIGQKAAYFTGSDYFVNLVEGGGLYGFDGIARLAGQMVQALAEPKDARRLIQQKGYGCTCCL